VYIRWLKWDLAGGGTLKFCVGATGKNDSPFDNILSIVVLQYFFLGQECHCGTKYLLDILMVIFWPIYTDMMMILC